MAQANIREIRTRIVPIIVDDKAYNLVYDLNAFADLEEEYGTISQVMDVLKNGSAVALRKVLLAGLQREHPDMGIVDAGRLIGMASLTDLAAIINDAISPSLPAADGEAGGKSKTYQRPPKR